MSSPDQPIIMRLVIELTVDKWFADLKNSSDKSERDCFHDDLLGDPELFLHSNLVGETIGTVKVVRDEMPVNARLIAAAPDLLAAVRALCDIHDDDLSYAFDEWRAARAAIAKATGEVG